MVTPGSDSEQFEPVTHGTHSMSCEPTGSALKYPVSHLQPPRSDAVPRSLVAWSGHALQAPMLVSRVVLDHVPSAQGISFPALHRIPAGQSAQWSALLRPSLRPTVPAAHGVGAELPALQNEKSVQLAQLVAPFSPW